MKLVVGNFKMKLDYSDIVAYNNYIAGKTMENISLILCPSYPYLTLFNNVALGSQNVSSFDSGAYTGEVSASQLKSLGITYAIVGHSERREHFKEDNLIISQKLKQLQEHEIMPILCIGETKEEKNLNKTKEVLKCELTEGLKDVSNLPIVVAYEPIWAIGSGLTPTLEEINETITYIKEVLSSLGFTKVSILYGGSVDESNIEEILKLNEVDGVLVGSFSTKYQSFIDALCKIGGNL